jgi:effector-binding domain-containing protein
MSLHEVEILTVPAMNAAVTRFHISADELGTIGEKIGPAMGEVMARLGGAGIAPAGPALAYYEPAGNGYDVAAGFRVSEPFTAPPGVERIDLGDIEVAHTTHLGSYTDLPTAYDDLRHGSAGLGRTLVQGGAMWEEYWSPPGTPDDQTRTEVYWPVAD